MVAVQLGVNFGWGSWGMLTLLAMPSLGSSADISGEANLHDGVIL